MPRYMGVLQLDSREDFKHCQHFTKIYCQACISIPFNSIPNSWAQVLYSTIRWVGAWEQVLWLLRFPESSFLPCFLVNRLISLFLRGLSIRKLSKSFSLHIFTKKWQPPKVSLPNRNYRAWTNNLVAKRPDLSTNFAKNFCNMIARKGLNIFTMSYWKTPLVKYTDTFLAGECQTSVYFARNRLNGHSSLLVSKR